MSTPGLSLKSIGLRLADFQSLNCIEGGRHHVPVNGVVVSASADGGYVCCLKCQTRIELVPLDS